VTRHRSYAQGVYLSLSNVLRHSDWTRVLNENSVDFGVNNLTAILREPVNLAIPYVRFKNLAFPYWFSNLKFYIKKKNQHFRRYKKSKSDHNCSVFLIIKVVKCTIKRDRLRWLKSIDDNLKTKPKDFWKYVSKFVEALCYKPEGRRFISQLDNWIFN
jgi:hypothetical protein